MLELKLSFEFQMIGHRFPDVVGATQVEQPYPTRPVEVVVEVLSPDDTVGRLLTKCRRYSKIGIGQIFVIDPDKRVGFEWTKQEGTLIEVTAIVLRDGRKINLLTFGTGSITIWARADM